MTLNDMIHFFLMHYDPNNCGLAFTAKALTFLNVIITQFWLKNCFFSCQLKLLEETLMALQSYDDVHLILKQIDNIQYFANKFGQKCFCYFLI